MEIGTEEKKNKKVDDAFHDADIDERDPNSDKDNEKTAANGGDSSDEEIIGDDDDATAVKLKSKVQDEQDYDEAAVDEERKDASDVESDADEMDVENAANDDENGSAAATDKEDVIAGLESNEFSQQYRVDKENHLWCELTFDLNMTYKNVDLSIVLKEVARKSVIIEVPQIRRAITYNKNDDIFLKTDGINITEMCKYMEMLDLNRLYTNQIHAMARTYGIEAAARVVVNVSV